MPYRFEQKQKNYADFASGRFFYGLPRHPALPVRLTSEIFQRAAALLRQQGEAQRLTIYDPCCGAAYHLATLGYLHGKQIARLIGSDVDEAAVNTAVRNLNLLNEAGWQQRMAEIGAMQTAFGKAVHNEAAESGHRLRGLWRAQMEQRTIELKTFVADGTNGRLLTAQLNEIPIDLVLADVPYGVRSEWWGDDAENGRFLWRLLEALRLVIQPYSVVAIVANKAQKCDHEAYQRRERFQIGKRRIIFLQKSL